MKVEPVPNPSPIGEIATDLQIIRTRGIQFPASGVKLNLQPNVQELESQLFLIFF